MKLSDSLPMERQASFPHLDPNYKCCCDAMHVKIGTQAIGIFYTVLAAFGILSSVLSKETSTLIVLLELVCLFLEVICIICLFISLCNERKDLLIPFTVWLCTLVLLYICLFLYFIYAAFVPYSYPGNIIRSFLLNDSEDSSPDQNSNGRGKIRVEDRFIDINLLVRMAAGIICTALLVTVLVHCWWISVIYKCYCYFSDVTRHREPYGYPILYNDIAYDRLRSAMTVQSARTPSMMSDEFSLRQMQQMQSLQSMNRISPSRSMGPVSISFPSQEEGIYFEVN
ncbi:hypothetical protein WR25_23441 [Diploscapter pachys]|uniref:Uncharacterized protein n=1 Tax=Diploscapter pachys TaxID=2018661 RepID=A0A2A2KQ99_9BILA|nr:hypothetical protein WR25_23441 [Diploscapter pachys]